MREALSTVYVVSNKARAAAAGIIIKDPYLIDGRQITLHKAFGRGAAHNTHCTHAADFIPLIKGREQRLG